MLFNNETIPPFAPREFQQKGFNVLTSHTEDCLVVAPPGAGKSYLMLKIAKEYIDKGKRVLISVNMLSVLNQMIVQAAEDWGFEIGVIQGNHHLTNARAKLQLASNMTLVKRDITNFDLCIIDEVHIIPKKLHDLLCNTKSRVLAFSATPYSKGLFKIFGENILNLSTAEELTKLGILAPLRIVSGTKIDRDKLSKNSYGEYSPESIEDATSEILGDTIELWKEYAENRQTLVFASRISHAQAISDEFNLAGIPSEVYCADTLPEIRKDIVRQFKNSEIKILVSVQAISVGFDAPIASVMIDLRPLRKSFSTLIQSIGRIMRSAPNKKEALLLDCTGNIVRMADDYIDLFKNGVTSLENADKKDKTPRDKEPSKDKELNGCPECQSKLWLKRTCLACGYQSPLEKSDIEHVKENVEFKELDIFAAAKKGETNKQLWTELSNYVYQWHDNPNYDKDKALKRCMAMYKQITGTWQQWGQRLTPSKNGYISKEVQNKITQLNIAYAKNKGDNK